MRDSSSGHARLALGGLAACVLAFSGCGGHAQDGLTDADREHVERTASLALETLDVDRDTREGALRGLEEHLWRSGSEHVERNIEALGPDLGDLADDEVSDVGSSAGGTNGRIGTSGGGNVPIGTQANTQTQIGTSGASGTSLGTSSGGTSTRPGTASSRFASLACESFGQLEAMDGSGDSVVFRMNCVSAASQPVIAWPDLQGSGPYRVTTVAIDLQTAANYETTSAAALLSSVWMTQVSGRSVTYAGPSLSTAGGAGMLVALVEAANGASAFFMALVL